MYNKEVFIFNSKFSIIAILGIGTVLFYLFFFHEGLLAPEKAVKKQTTVTSFNQQKLYSDQAITPIPLSNVFDEKKASLGNKLFHDPILSSNNSIACASCHSLFTAGVDKSPVSIGINGAFGSMNSPTVFNSRYNFSQFWNGRASSLEEQVADPINNHQEMGSNWQEVLTKLKADKFYLSTFNQLYPDGITEVNIANAIAEFERSLTTPNALFDQYLRGNKKALSPDALIGYQKFMDYGCISCHQGVNLGGNMFQKLGVIYNYFTEQNTDKDKDKNNVKSNVGSNVESNLGRYSLTQKIADKHVFKVPGLRNVAVTAPYFHDGSIEKLSEAISIMGYYQLGQRLTDEDIKQLKEFLESLTGEWQGERLK